MSERPYTEKELTEMLWELRRAWFARVIGQCSDPDHWEDELTEYERRLSSEFNDLMHRVVNAHMYTKQGE